MWVLTHNLHSWFCLCWRKWRCFSRHLTSVKSTGFQGKCTKHNLSAVGERQLEKKYIINSNYALKLWQIFLKLYKKKLNIFDFLWSSTLLVLLDIKLLASSFLLSFLFVLYKIYFVLSLQKTTDEDWQESVNLEYFYSMLITRVKQARTR